MINKIAVQKSNKTVLELPPKYQVILLNDDFTTMDFVVEVLVKFFGFNLHSAHRIMLNIHQQGQGICGYYYYEIAEMKVNQVTNYAREHGYPLRCIMEKI